MNGLRYKFTVPRTDSSIHFSADISDAVVDLNSAFLLRLNVERNLESGIVLGGGGRRGQGHKSLLFTDRTEKQLIKAKEKTYVLTRMDPKH